VRLREVLIWTRRNPLKLVVFASVSNKDYVNLIIDRADREA
jgi:hypothetical protein